MFISKVFFLFFVCMLAVCGNSGLQTENTIETQQTDKTELSLTMKRTGCYGTCPIYTLNIQPNGKVSFDGEGFTKVMGKAESSLDEEKIKQIIAEIDKADFYSLKDFYTEDSGNCPLSATDNPTVTLFVKLKGKEKTITHYLGCRSEINPSKGRGLSIFPQQLYNLENKIDEIVETKRWIGERK